MAWEFRVRKIGDLSTWESMTASRAESIHSKKHARNLAAMLADITNVEEVRYNEVGSLQGHYIRAGEAVTQLTIPYEGEQA